MSSNKPASQPKQLEIAEINFSEWYKVSEFLPPSFLPCTLSRHGDGTVNFSREGAAYYSNERGGWFWFGNSSKFPDTKIDIDETTRWKPAQ